MQHDLFLSSLDLGLSSDIDLTFEKVIMHIFDAPRKEHDGVQIMTLAFLVQKFAKITFLPKTAVFTLCDVSGLKH